MDGFLTKPLDRECLLLCADGFNYGEIVAITGLTLPAVKGRIFRARRDLRAHLEAEEPVHEH